MDSFPTFLTTIIRYNGVPGIYVDIVKNVINSTAVHWAAERLVRPFFRTIKHGALTYSNYPEVRNLDQEQGEPQRAVH